MSAAVAGVAATPPPTTAAAAKAFSQTTKSRKKPNPLFVSFLPPNEALLCQNGLFFRQY